MLSGSNDIALLSQHIPSSQTLSNALLTTDLVLDGEEEAKQACAVAGKKDPVTDQVHSVTAGANLTTESGPMLPGKTGRNSMLGELKSKGAHKGSVRRRNHHYTYGIHILSF
jgi:hypothetical protein